MTARKKQRLDLLLVERGLVADIDQARRLIGSGVVRVDEQRADKVGSRVLFDARLTVKETKRYVSRGGDKLESGLRGLGLSPAGLVCVDVGSSTGGFSDCLLQHGARKVYCVDVGYGLLDWKLRRDARVVVLERINARHLSSEHIPEPIDLAVIDASFISLEPLLAPLIPLFHGDVRIVALVKPQFQLPRELVAPGGIVVDADLQQQALAMVRQFAQELGLHCVRAVASEVKGAKGNQEYFMLLIGTPGPGAQGNENYQPRRT